MSKHLDQLRVLNFMYSKHLVSPRSVALGLGRQVDHLSAPVEIEDILPFDQDHFGGTEAVDRCIAVAGIRRSSTVLDIGSGLGGPSRYIAWKTGAKVVGVEIQEDRCDCSVKLTEAARLNGKVHFIQGDVAYTHVPAASFTHVIAFLSIVHVVEKKLVLERIGSSLAPRGVVYVEDYCVGRPVSDENRRDLLLTISCPGLQNRDEYFAAFGEAGIVVKPEDIHDTTGEWGRLAKNRHREFVSDFEGIVGRYGTQTARDALSLYESVARLFERGIIQGLRFVGTKVPKD